MDTVWNAAFITPARALNSPLVWRAFHAENVVSARLDVTGLGLYRAFLNGERVGRDYLTPGFNDYDDYLRYQSYDVTALIKADNLIEVALGNGWYRGRFGTEGQSHIYGDSFLLSARLTLMHADGTVSALTSDESWSAAESVIRDNSIYDGETRDDTYPRGEAVPCRVIDVAYRPEPQFSPPIRVVAELKPTRITTPHGETVLDFGQNMAGVVRFRNRLPRGGKLRLQFGEILQNGCFYRDNLRSALAEYRYVSDGEDKTVEPYFTYYGFRYAAVESDGPIDPADFTALALSSGLTETLGVSTDSEKINRLLENVLWGQRSNFLDLPTDCPQRDERLGWTADAQVFVNTACYQADCKAFYRKYMRDLRADQRRYFSGNLPMYSPSLKGACGPGGAAWADAATVVPWHVYLQYGDKALLRESYPLMRDYAETLIAADAAHGGTHLIDYGFCFGDWLALDGPTALSMKGGTEDAFIQSVYYYHSLRLAALAAETLSETADAARYTQAADAAYQALLDEYVTPAGRLAIGTQTGYVLALTHGLWRDKKRIAEGLRARLVQDGFALKTGFVGTPLLLPALFECGMADAAYRLLYREDFPGWLYAVNLGATTVWERWNSVLPDGTVSETGMNSLNHYAYGAVAEAVYGYIAGLRVETPGWRSAVIAPQPSWRMKHIALSFESPAGRYEVRWEIEKDGRFSCALHIPDGASALVTLPAHPEAYSERLEAGAHSFCYTPTEDYLHPFSADTPACDLMAAPEAAAVLRAETPGLYDFLSAQGCGMRGESLNTLAGCLPFTGADEVRRADEKLRRLRV